MVLLKCNFLPFVLFHVLPWEIGSVCQGRMNTSTFVFKVLKWCWKGEKELQSLVRCKYLKVCTKDKKFTPVWFWKRLNICTHILCIISVSFKKYFLMLCLLICKFRRIENVAIIHIWFFPFGWGLGKLIYKCSYIHMK